MRTSIGKPTEYGYQLPAIRHQLCGHAIENLPVRTRMLDYGCGNGANTVLFHNDFQTVTGIDVESSRVQEGTEYLTAKGITNIDLATYDGETIPFDDESFHLVTSFEVLEHVADDSASLREIHRVLKKDGGLCVSVPNKWYMMETHGFNLPFGHVIPWNRVPFLNLMPRWFYRKWGKARIYTKTEISRLLHEAGFKIVSHHYIKPPFDIVGSKNAREMFRSIYGWMPDFMGVSLFIECKK